MTGTGTLLRLALRRDRLLLPAWILSLTVMVAFSVKATTDLYPTTASMGSAATTLNSSPALVALYGKVYDPTSLGALSLIKLTAFGSAMVAILFVFMVVRHTRADEESGRLELISAGAVGRSAPLTAALLLAAIGSLTLGALTAVGLGLVGLPWSGALAFGSGWALSGIVFGALGGVAAQITTSTRTAVGLGVAAVALAYLLRAVGDLGSADPGWSTWLSPIGWSQQIRPFAGDRWWVTALPIASAAVLVPLAFVLRSRRDLGAGYLPDRTGPARGNIGGVLGLAWRLQRGLLVAWLVGAALMGLVLGSIADNVAGLLDSPEMRKYVELLGGVQGLTDAFLAAEIGILASIAAALAVSSTARLRAEEVSGHAELLLSTPTSRLRWALSQVTVALLGVAAVMLVAGAAVGLAHGLAIDDAGGQTVRLAGAAAAQIPALWVMVGITAVIFGWLPRAILGAWALLLAFIIVGEFGSLWRLPQLVMDASPFQHSPRLPGGTISASATAWLLGAAVALLGLGLWGWRRRDLQA